MKHWQKACPPYEGAQPYLYFAFAQADSGKVWNLLRSLVERGCRVWYEYGPSGSAEELLRRQERSSGSALTVLYLSDAACEDKDTKSSVLVNQKNGVPIVCLDPDRRDRCLSMGLKDYIPHIPLYELVDSAEVENAILHADGFSQEMLGEPVRIRGGRTVTLVSALLLILTLLLAGIGFVGFRYLHWFKTVPKDEVAFCDPVIESAIRDAARGGNITEELVSGIRYLRLGDIPNSWEDLSLLPSLERIVVPQTAVAEGGSLPEGGYVIELGRMGGT